VLGPDVAAGLLVSRTGDPDRQAARELAGLLGGLPLALEQAAAYLQAVGDTLAGYLALFRQQRAGLLARGEPTGYSKTVASTWALAFDRLQQTESGAVELLRLLAFCAPEAIPLRLLLQSRPGLTEQLGDQVAPLLAPLIEEPLAAGDAIGALRRYSLVTVAGGGSVSLHRLVQVVTADQMPADLARQWRQATAVLIEAALPAEPWMSGAWPVCAMLLPHARAALPDDSDGIARLANYLGSSGSYAAARDLQRRALNARERVLGSQYPDTLAAQHELGRWTGEAGDLAAARDLFATLLPVREQVLGPQHPGTLSTRHELALYTGMTGGIAAARDLFAELLPMREQVLGPQHPDTLGARHELALWTGEAGDPVAARDQFAELLPIKERVLGAQHPYTLIALYELARWTGEAGDPVAARDQFVGLLPAFEQILGPQHPYALTSRTNLARWTGRAGDPVAARDLVAGVLPAFEQVLGGQHPDTLDARHELAIWTVEANGEPSTA